MDNRKELIEKILDELLGRKGFDAWWCDIDEDIQEEIKETLVNILPIAVDDNLVKITLLKQLEELSDHIPCEIYTRKVIEIQKQ